MKAAALTHVLMEENYKEICIPNYSPQAGGQELGDNGQMRFRGGGKLFLFLCMAA